MRAAPTHLALCSEGFCHRDGVMVTLFLSQSCQKESPSGEILMKGFVLLNIPKLLCASTNVFCIVKTCSEQAVLVEGGEGKGLSQRW